MYSNTKHYEKVSYYHRVDTLFLDIKRPDPYRLPGCVRAGNFHACRPIQMGLGAGHYVEFHGSSLQFKTGSRKEGLPELHPDSHGSNHE